MADDRAAVARRHERDRRRAVLAQSGGAGGLLEQVQEQIDRVLAAPLFAEVGSLDVFPSSNQVLHKQQGYREIFQTFALAEVGAGVVARS